MAALDVNSQAPIRNAQSPFSEGRPAAGSLRKIWTSTFAILEFVLFTFCGIGAAFAFEKAWLNVVLRSGLVVYCFTNASFPISDPFHGPVPKLLKLSPGWSFQLRWTGIAAASTLICVGAVITRSAVGYLIGSCAFFYAWLLWWMLRKISPELHKEQSVATDT